MMRQDFWSRFHRFFGFSFCKDGLCFNHKGDEIIWMFPWRRQIQKNKFLSIGFCGVFDTIKEIDDEWEKYWASMRGEK